MSQIRAIFNLGVITLLFFVIGCGGGGSSFSLLPSSDTFVQSKNNVSNKVDILFVINDQPSMSAFQDALSASFATFMQVFQDKGFDFKIAVVTTSGYMADPTLSGYDPADVAEADFNDTDGVIFSGYPVLFPTTPDLFNNFTINAHPSKNTSGQDARSFSSMRQGLQSTRATNIGFLRSDAFLAVVIVDNKDDFSGNGRCNGCNINQKYNAPTLDPVSTYEQFLDTITNSSGASRRYNVSAMTQIAQPCQGGDNMVRIMELANNTGGVLGNICDADFGPSMVDISNNIAVQSTQFYLGRIPIVSTIVVHVDGVLVPNDPTNGWTYDATANSILFNGSAIPSTGQAISVDYDPASYGS